MTGNDFVLDTNIIIELFKGNKTIALYFERCEIVNISFVALGELYLGAYRSASPAKHIKQITNFLDKFNILTADEKTSDSHALVKSSLLRKGKPILENDIWIAAIAIQYQMTLITTDKHFNDVDGLLTDRWE